MSNRAGQYVNHLGVRCFRPAPLPPDIGMSPDLTLLLSQADRALARLDGASLTVPDPGLFVYSFMRQEATLSSHIEGTESSLTDLFQQEAAISGPRGKSDVDDIVNYLAAMNWGIASLHTLPLSLRLVRGMHAKLMASGRGAQKNPGAFRSGQNHIGPPGCTIDEATFVPPAVSLMKEALDDWERYLHRKELPPLVRVAIIHAQFETIQPFWDGNGRIGRMLITLILIKEEILVQPLLYLSIFFKAHRSEYYRRLQAIRDEGDWEGWLEFFLRGVRHTSRLALDTAQHIVQLQQSTVNRAQGLGQSGNNARLAEALFRKPLVTANAVADLLNVSHQTSMNLIHRFVEASILSPVGNRNRDRIYEFTDYVRLLSEQSLTED